MPSRGVNAVRRNIKLTIGHITGPMAKRAITEALIIGGGAADVMTPVDTSFLINSRYRVVTQGRSGWNGRFGYAAKYAADVHEKPGTNVGKNTQRDPSNPSRGVMWAPAGEPEFLKKGFEQSKALISKAVLRAMRI
jgi:hypothetical protein